MNWKTSRLFFSSSFSVPSSSLRLYRRGDDERDADDDGADDDGERDVLVFLQLLADGEGRGLDDDEVGDAEDEQAEGGEDGRRDEHGRQLLKLHHQTERVRRVCQVEHHFPPW